MYSWLSWEAMWFLYEVIALLKNPFDWIDGPLRRSTAGWIIFWIGIVLNNIPLVNFVTAFFMAWWAVADFYDYEYALFGI